MLIEALVTAALLSVVLGAVLAMSDGSAQMAVRDQERAHVIRDAQVGLHRMTRELRQSYNVVSWSATAFEADVLTSTGNVRVIYDCAIAHPTLAGTKRCVRTSDGVSNVIIDHVSSAAFTYQLDDGTPRYADLKLKVKASGDATDGHPHEIELHDGFYMRNRNG